MYTVSDDVKVLNFDIWETLLGGNKAFTRPRLQLIFELLGHPGIDVELLRDAYRQADRFYNMQSEIDGLDYGLAERLRNMYVTFGITDDVPPAQDLRAIQDQVATLRLRPEYMPPLLEPDLPDTLAALCACGFELGLLSNTGMDNEQVMELVLQQLGIWDIFKVRVFSSQDGRAKPNPDLFGRVVKEFGVESSEVLHIGDNTNADYRAIEAGLSAVVFAPKGVEGYPFITSMKQLLR